MLRVQSISFTNLSRKTAKQTSQEMVGVVGDQIRANITFNWNSVFWGTGFNDVEFTPDPKDIGLASGTSTIGYVYSTDSIFTAEDWKVGDYIGVYTAGVIDPIKFFVITQIISPEILVFDINGSTDFNSNFTLGANDYIGCAPLFDNLVFDYSINNNFGSFNLNDIGNGQWRAFEATLATINYNDNSKGINRIPSTFTVNQILRTGNDLDFTFTIQHTFILYPFHLAGEEAPESVDRFEGLNCLSYYFQANIKKHDLQNDRIILSTSQNGNTGGINQTINSGIDKVTAYDLAIVDSQSNPVTNILYPDTYIATFKLNYGGLTPDEADTAKAWGYIEQEIIDNDKTFRQFYQFDSSTRTNVNFLTGAASPNDFSDYILVNTVRAQTISGNTVVTITFKVMESTPLGNFVLCLNHEADTLNNTRKNIFIFSLPISPTPPDLGVTFDSTRFVKDTGTIDRISPNMEILAINRFFVKVDPLTDVRIDRIRLKFIAKTVSDAFINTIEQTDINTLGAKVLDGIFQNLVYTIAKSYPREASDLYKNITVNRNSNFDTSDLRCFEVQTPYIFRYEDWRQFIAINGEILTSSAFDPTKEFNGFQQVWQRFSTYFDHVIELTCSLDGVQYLLSNDIDEELEFEDYDTGTITVTNDTQNGLFVDFADNVVTATKTDASFEDYSELDARGILWANLYRNGGIETNARVSSLRSPDPYRLWKSDNVEITKTNPTTFQLRATLNGKRIKEGANKLSIWSDLSFVEPPNGFFIFEVKTDNAGTSASDSFSLPLVSTGTYSFDVDWGDNSVSTITAWNDTAKTHQYASAGTYTITIIGVLSGWAFNNGGDRLKLLSITRWGCFESGNTIGAFRGCKNLDLTTIDDVPYLGNTTTLSFFFAECTSLTTIDKINDWDVTNITNMNGMFYNATSFNDDMNDWDVSNVTNMRSLFDYATSFNGNITSWQTTSATNMSFMFYNCAVFNQDISGFDTSNVTNFDSMFTFAVAFNQDIGGWDMSRAQNINSMFQFCTAFNKDISSWNVSDVTSAFNFMGGKTTADYSHLDAIYNTWSTLSLQSAVTCSFGTIEYTAAAVTGRNNLVSQGWNLTDGGLI